MKILICDDDEMIIRQILFVLDQDNLKDVTITRDGFQAMKQLREQEFDLVITDLHMPHHNGDEILNLIRIVQKRTTPIIMVSSDAEKEIRALAKKEGVSEFIEKPIKLKEFSKIVKRLLKL